MYNVLLSIQKYPLRLLTQGQNYRNNFFLFILVAFSASLPPLVLRWPLCSGLGCCSLLSFCAWWRVWAALLKPILPSRRVLGTTPHRQSGPNTTQLSGIMSTSSPDRGGSGSIVILYWYSLVIFKDWNIGGSLLLWLYLRFQNECQVNVIYNPHSQTHISPHWKVQKITINLQINHNRDIS